MKLSIVTVCFNSGKTLEATIKSVISQEYENLEYIIVDGGSNDNTLEVIYKYEKYITKWISEPDRGISDAFNKGIRMATGDYICLLNADDCLIDGVLNKIVVSINPETEILHGNRFDVKKDGTLRLVRPNCNYSLLQRKGMVLNHPGMFIAKKAYEKYGLYSTEYRCVMDRELLARMYSQGAVFQYLDLPIAIYAIDGVSSKRFISVTCPESFRISKSYGSSSFSIILHLGSRILIMLLSRLKHRVIRDE